MTDETLDCLLVIIELVLYNIFILLMGSVEKKRDISFFTIHLYFYNFRLGSIFKSNNNNSTLVIICYKVKIIHINSIIVTYV